MTRTLCLLFFSSALLLSACRPQEAVNTEAAGTETVATATATPATPEPPVTDATGTAPAAGAQGLLMRVETDGDLKMGTVPVVVYVLNGGEGVSGATVNVTGDMTHAGMAPLSATATETEPGLYRAEGFEFGMAGDWLITAEATLPDGEKESAELAVTVPGQ